MEVARGYVEEHHHHDSGVLVLRHWQGTFWSWRTSHWGEQEASATRARLYEYTEFAWFEDDDEPRPWSPNRRRIGDLEEALAAVCHLSREVEQPSWLPGSEAPGGRIVACANGLLELATRQLLPHTPTFWNAVAVAIDYDPAAPEPSRWLDFLHELWEEDTQQIAALQEWFGYVVAGRTDLHKMLLVVGPTRAGKGVICRVLEALVGRSNVAGPTLSSLRGEFGLQPLIGKSLAVIADARLGGSGTNTVVERLLSISGEDALTVNIKNRAQWTGRLSSRVVLCSNELPRLGDASGAIAGRFVTLLLERSWFGREDPDLGRKLQAELPGVLNWALEGLERLERQGRFTESEAARAAFAQLQDLASPVRAFVRDACEVDPEATVPVETLWRVWKEWAHSNGHREGTKQGFGRDLRAVLPQVRQARVGGHDSQARERCYTGIRPLWGATLGEQL
jgi:putative DNA primase/helicase